MIVQRLLFAAVLLIAVLFCGTTAAWIGTLTAAVMGAASAVLTVMNRRSWSVQLTSPVILEKGKTAELTIHAESRSRLPVGRLYIRLLTCNDLTGEQKSLKLLLSAGESRTIQLTADHCGRLTITAEQIRLLGLLGVLSVKTPLTASCRTTVLPDTFVPELRLTVPDLDNRDSDSYAPDRKGNDPTELYQLRDYAPGDSLRRVHWKLSSKLDQLVVREDSCPVEQSLLVFWDRSAPASPAETDTQAEVFASLCQALCQIGRRFTMGWNERENAVYLPIDGEDDLLRAIPMALQSGTAPHIDPEPYGKTILLTADAVSDERTVVLHCGEDIPGAICYTTETYLTRLQRMEL